MCPNRVVCQGPTVLKSCSDDFLRRRSDPSPVTGLHHHAILGEFLQVIQCINLAVPSGVDADDVELEISPRAVLPVTDLVPTDNSILQMLLWSLNRKWEVAHWVHTSKVKLFLLKFLGKKTNPKPSLTFTFYLLNPSPFQGSNSKILPAHETTTFVNHINFRCGFFSKSVLKDL